MKPCCSRAAWYSAFSFRSPCARASAIALITAGRLTDLVRPAQRAGAARPGWSVVLSLLPQLLMQFLQRPDRAAATIFQRMQQGPGAGNGGRIGHALLQRLAPDRERVGDRLRSEEHTSELQSLMRISYAVFCLKKHKL